MTRARRRVSFCHNYSCTINKQTANAVFETLADKLKLALFVLCEYFIFLIKKIDQLVRQAAPCS